MVQLLHNTLDDFRFTLQQFWSKFLIQPGLKEGRLSVKARKTLATHPHQREGKNTAAARRSASAPERPALNNPRVPRPKPVALAHGTCSRLWISCAGVSTISSLSPSESPPAAAAIAPANRPPEPRATAHAQQPGNVDKDSRYGFLASQETD